jgi:soluble lytic murein transglycosylase-like protein
MKRISLITDNPPTMREPPGAGRLRCLLQGALGAVRDGVTALALAAALFGVAQQPSMTPAPDLDQPAALVDAQPANSPVELTVDSWNLKYWTLAVHLSKRYRIAPDEAEDWVSAAHVAGERMSIDPLLVLAVIAVESSFDPNAQSLAGARGLMQVIPKYHEDKLEQHGGSGALLDPTVNILVGARILEQYIRHAGSIEAGLQRYNGALSDGSGRYARRVLAERERLRLIVDQSERTRVVF